MAVRSRDPDAADEPPRLTGYLEPAEDGADVFTVTPEDATGYDRMSRWISVPETMVCDLEAMR